MRLEDKVKNLIFSFLQYSCFKVVRLSSNQELFKYTLTTIHRPYLALTVFSRGEVPITEALQDFIENEEVYPLAQMLKENDQQTLLELKAEIKGLREEALGIKDRRNKRKKL